VTVHAAVERPRILAYLADHPGQTAYEIAAALGYGKPKSYTVASIIQQMWRKGMLVYELGWRPHLGRQARLWRVAPPGTEPPPRDTSPATAEHRRELSRMNKQRQRARAAGLHVERGAQLHPRRRAAVPSSPPGRLLTDAQQAVIDAHEAIGDATTQAGLEAAEAAHTAAAALDTRETELEAGG
jgi:hypothetical protein